MLLVQNNWALKISAGEQDSLPDPHIKVKHKWKNKFDINSNTRVVLQLFQQNKMARILRKAVSCLSVLCHKTELNTKLRQKIRLRPMTPEK